MDQSNYIISEVNFQPLSGLIQSVQNAVMDPGNSHTEEALESMGRVRPSIFSSAAAAELSFCFSLVLSHIMAVGVIFTPYSTVISNRPP
jgi:hypothetical protein